MARGRLITESISKNTPEGPLVNMLDEIIQLIAAAAPIKNAFRLARTNKRNHELLLFPTRKRFLQQFAIAKINVDRNNTYCISRSGAVLMCKNSHIRKANFQWFPDLVDVKQALDSGWDFSFFVKNSGEVLAKGVSTEGYYPQTYLSPSDQPELVEWLAGITITKAMDDGYSACFLSDNGQITVVGTDGWGELGQGVEHTSLIEPKIIENIAPIQDFHYTGHQLLLFTAQNILNSGRNDVGQLGVGHNNSVFSHIPITLNGIDIKLVKVGDAKRFYGLTTLGYVCAWGDNTDGLLGFGDQQEHNLPALLPGLYNIVYMDVSATCAMFVDKLGKVFGVGANIFGELGMGDSMLHATPTPNPHLSSIEKVFCKNEKSFFCTKNQTFFAGKIKDVLINKPQLIFTNPETIEQIETYNDEFIYLTNDGALYLNLSKYYLITSPAWIMHTHPKLHLFSPVKEMLKNASVKELLFYAAGKDGFARYCLQRALEKIKLARTTEALTAMLTELDSPAWNNCSQIREILPAYQSVVYYTRPQTTNPVDALAIKMAWAHLIVMYRNALHKVKSQPNLLSAFKEMLNGITTSQPGFFKPTMSKTALSMLAQLPCQRYALQIVAKYLIVDLPPCPPSLKRNAEEELADDGRKATFKKAKK